MPEPMPLDEPIPDTERSPRGPHETLDRAVSRLGPDEVVVLARIAERLTVGARVFLADSAPDDAHGRRPRHRRSSASGTGFSKEHRMHSFMFNDTADVYSPRAWADRELAWFFPKVDIVGKGRQLFEVLAPGGSALGGLGAQVRVIRAYNTILARLRALGDPDAGVLECAYAERTWPYELTKRYGHLTGVMARIAAAEMGALPDDDDARAVRDVRAATSLAREVATYGASDLAGLERAATKRFARAFRGYVRERGEVSSTLLSLE